MQNYDSTHPYYVARTPDAATAARRPQAGARLQDSNPAANVGKTFVREGGNVMFPKGGTQPTQPNPSSLRQ